MLTTLEVSLKILFEFSQNLNGKVSKFQLKYNFISSIKSQTFLILETEALLFSN